MYQITYLFGAGASANALPINKKMDGESAPSQFISELERFKTTIEQFDEASIHLDRIEEILKICMELGTPDLCAKYLLETANMPKYRLLKRLISNYFSYKETVIEARPNIYSTFGRNEPRPLSFLTAISSDQKLPSNVKIISWNYDSQMEIAAEKLRLFNVNAPNKIDGFSSWPNIGSDFNRDFVASPPFLMHINGIAGYNYSLRNFAEPIENPLSLDDEADSLLSFAWEIAEDGKRLFTERRQKILEKMCEGTKYLVVIGYSFPFFNRKFDKLIFQKMAPSLEKIYIQDPYNDGRELKAQYDLGRKVEIVHINNADSYFIPYEF
jgi:hypothetical protein